MRPLLGAFFVGLNETAQSTSPKKQAPRQPLIEAWHGACFAFSKILAVISQHQTCHWDKPNTHGSV